MLFVGFELKETENGAICDMSKAVDEFESSIKLGQPKNKG